LTKVYTTNTTKVPAQDYDLETLVEATLQGKPSSYVADISLQELGRFLYDASILNVYKPETIVLGRDTLILYAYFGHTTQDEYEQEARDTLLSLFRLLGIRAHLGIHCIEFNTRMISLEERFISCTITSTYCIFEQGSSFTLGGRILPSMGA
jgi:hypothetical protein